MKEMQLAQVMIEHCVITSNKPYEQVNAALLKQVSIGDSLNTLITQLLACNTPWEKAYPQIQSQLGPSGFHIFCTIQHGQILALAGKPRKIVQYTMGNPLIALQMTQHVAGAALYAPFKLVLYEDEPDRTIISYDRFTPCLAQFENKEVNQVAQRVDDLLQKLIAKIV